MIEKKHLEWARLDRYFWLGVVIGAFTVALVGMLLGAFVDARTVWLMDTAIVLAPAVAVLVIRQQRAQKKRWDQKESGPDSTGETLSEAPSDAKKEWSWWGDK